MVVLVTVTMFVFFELGHHFLGMQVVKVAFGQQTLLWAEHLHGASKAGVEAAYGAHYIDAIQFTSGWLSDG
jgi:hypothetical protein